MTDDAINLLIFGMGGTARAAEKCRRELERVTGRRTIFAPSLRFGNPRTAEPPKNFPRALARQAAHVNDVLLSSIDTPVDVYVYTISLGTPVGAIFTYKFGGEGGMYRVKRFVPITPANLYEENFLGLASKIGAKVVDDLGTSAGRTYWFSAIPGYFVNPIRSTREGWEVCQSAVADDVMKLLVNKGIPVMAGVARDDNVFPYDHVVEALDAIGVDHFDLPPGSKHRPDFRPKELIETLRAAGALDLA